MRIAMWSGPRNLSTAMMYSFGARSDCAIWDEPFYASYLHETGIMHPMNREILEDGETDPQGVIDACLGRIPNDKPNYFLKLMSQHMISGFDRSWINDVTNIFLIRHPARVIASYHAKREDPVFEDLGFREQLELFNQARDAGQTPVVVDATDMRANPKRLMPLVCTALGLPFEPEMLRWPAGGHKDDGAWAPHWYGAVWKSEAFSPDKSKEPLLPKHLQPLLVQAMESYRVLSEHKISVG